MATRNRITSVLSIAIMTLTFLSIYISVSLQLPSANENDEAGSFGLKDGVRRRRSYFTIEELSSNPPAGSIVCPNSLIPVYDRPSSFDFDSSAVTDDVIKNANTTTIDEPRKIPRTIHASMQSRCVSPDTFDVLQSWKDALPNHSFYFHDDTAVDRLFDMPWEEFPQLRHYMRCVRFKGAMRIDVWRILVIYRYGGIYTDVDMFPSEKFTEMDPIGMDDEAVFLSDSFNRPSQWFFAMEPKHPIAYYTMIRIFENLLNLENIERPAVVFVTGPNALKVGYSDALGWRTDIDMLAEGTYNCKWGKKAKKLSRKHGYVNQLDMKEMVDWNATVKVTRKQRMEWLTGVKHWMDQKNSKKVEFGGSCRDYLYALDHGLNSTSDELK